MNDTTKKNFSEFYDRILPYLNGKAHSGFTPVGTIISVMGKTAPMNYLACDGTVYNIADYPELAAYFAEQFEASNYFGGNGTTTFAVPDLRGEFIRGTGTNSHTGNGDGANVGVHQDATIAPKAWGNPNNLGVAGNNDLVSDTQNFDTENRTSWAKYIAGSVVTGDYPDSALYTSRPTNTSVLFCIAAKNIFMDAGMNYSTEEQVVGTWIDGKTIYQKTFTGLSATINTNSWTNGICTIPNGDNIVDFKAYTVEDTLILDISSSLDLILIYKPTGSVNTLSFDGTQARQINILTLQYTKTTD